MTGHSNGVRIAPARDVVAEKAANEMEVRRQSGETSRAAAAARLIEANVRRQPVQGIERGREPRAVFRASHRAVRQPLNCRQCNR
ncbi:MAG: hypothetical protein JOY90_31365 [Bradyrhizobium sp.]|uniref:hypothetical protein n=1 Tax=Bradyrhizobium sp. TaxID=376 RepID=UPI001D9CA0FD|nr:hypothetical protein [Bradyrhizobium sp.]MBV9564912.1 hypothetical protein [Bradyrhizobium sp.]